jgi:uncharacterized membrane protein
VPTLPRLFTLIVVVLSLATAVGLALLWPGPVKQTIDAGLLADSDRGKVESVSEFACAGSRGNTCRRAGVRLETGPERGKRVQVALDVQGLDPDMSVGDRVRVVKDTVPRGQQPGGELDSEQQLQQASVYTIVDFERRGPMLLLALVFAAAVLLFGRLRGALSLVGLALSLAVVLLFATPAILDGKPPLLVALVASFAVMLSTIALAHGLGPKSIAAILGTAGSLLLTVGLAVLFTGLTHLTGLSSEEAAILQLDGAQVNFQGLLLAGMVIGALGVLDDVTISQSSTVMALRGANPGLGFRQLFALAMRVGRDHVSATVNTLVLAYVGASLPLLLLFSSGELGVLDVLNLELVAKEIVATLVGSIGLIAAVPITTALAVALSGALSPERLAVEAAGGHAH